ncbi:MAG: sigma-54-dependent Fis family transcriptional regulator, partial [Geobacteraceae bacterium]|nr:sigma-54-dependent Fis family transcriptional regulator [Geobacteraceae bacterium]
AGAPVSSGVEQAGGDVPYTAALEHFEADLLANLLKRHGGNIDAAAREAGMNMVTMYRKIKRYGIRKD